MNPYRSLPFKDRHESTKPRSKWKTLVWKFLIWSKGTWRERFDRERCEYCSWKHIEPRIGDEIRLPQLIIHRLEGCERFEKRRHKRFIPPKTVLE